MPLRVDYVGRLDDIIEPAVEYLSRPVDLFYRQHLVVPTAGVKAWLLPELAKHLGTSGKQDGVVANVQVDYPGSLARFLTPKQDGQVDKWSIQNLTFVLLEIIANNPAYVEIIKRSGGPLLAARAIADRFDRYHVRRPAMIRQWENKIPTLSPTASDEFRDDQRVTKQLDKSDIWQYELWRKAREQIDEPSSPARQQSSKDGIPKELLVAGLQTLNLQQTQVLKELSQICDVQVLLVHPSAPLQKRWATNTPVTPDLAIVRSDAEIPDDVDPLVYSWLRGTQETQILLASQGITPTHKTQTQSPPAHDLLGHLQHIVTDALLATPRSFDPTDHSLSIHRCHSIGRQVEVLHDALLHAFAELPDLEPHEVVILSPDINNAAPYLQATFARQLTIDGRKIQIPLVVADRGIREVSAGAELLGNLLELIGSRCSVDGVMAVATSALVLDQLGVNSETVETWQRYIERTNIRWGLTAEHRQRVGLQAGAIDAHSWKLGLERMILGATLPDATPAPALGGVVPLDDVDLADIDDIAALIRVFDVVLNLDLLTSSDRTVGEWCDALENALETLCGQNCNELETPLRQLESLRASANDVAVPFADVKALVGQLLTEIAGRQPLRTGAVTATSMVPLRGVPYRVVCVLGFDDDAIASSDAEGDDLTERQRLIGDSDPRLEVRRALLDAMLSARDRMIITCTGTSIKNNTTLPLATPLAEFADFVRRATGDVEVIHPRHSSSRANFLPDAVQSGIIWSHDPVARSIASNLGKAIAPVHSAVGVTPDLDVLELSELEQFVRDPLRLFVRRALAINTWRENESATPAIFPLSLTKREHRDRSEQLLQILLDGSDPSDEAKWREALQVSGLLPVGVFGDAELDEITQLVHGIVAEGAAKQIPLRGGTAHDIRGTAGSYQVVGRIEGVHEDSGQIVMISTEDDWDKIKPVAALRILVATAFGLPIDRLTVVTRHDKWEPGAVTTTGAPVPVAQFRTLRLDPTITQVQAVNRLAVLGDLVRLALASPCGSFDGAASKTLANRGDGRKRFDQFVGGRSYQYSSESVVYGTHPNFDDVFGANSPELAFRARFDEQLTISYKGAKQGYLVS
ncbi:MAG: exodeoxyribonuclease V subunit gamma [Ilumatobacteraceae bacterium]